MPKVLQDRIIWDADDFLSPQEETSGGNYTRKIGNGATFIDQVDPLRAVGYISPSFNPSAATNASQITAVLRNAVLKGNYSYIVSAGALLHRLELNTVAGNILTSDATWPHTIAHGAHTGETGSDCVPYYVGANHRLFYSFYDATDWDVGIYDFSTTFDDDFMSTVPASPLAAPYLTGGLGYPHPMIVGDDDVLYIGDRNFVHAYDGQVGANGTFYPAVLTLPKGYVVTSFARSDNNISLFIGSYYEHSAGASTIYKGSALVWEWDYLSLDPDRKYDLKDNYVSEIFNWNGTIAAFTNGRKTLAQTGEYKLQVLTSSGFAPVYTYSTGTLPIRGGVEVVQDDIYWNAGGKIYFYVKNPFTNSYFSGNISGSGSGTSGMLKMFRNTYQMHFSRGTGAGDGLFLMSDDYGESGTWDGKVVYPIFPNGKKGKIKQTDITFKAAVSGAGRTITVNTLIDGSSSTAVSAFTTITDMKKKIVLNRDDGTPLGDFVSIAPELVWAGGTGATKCPQVEKIEIFYETINIE